MSTQVIDEFHKLFYPIHGRTTWRGYQCLKCPLDLWQYQEIIYHTKPGIIIELGAAMGGSALFMRDVQRSIGITNSAVVSIDIRRVDWPKQEGLFFICADSLADWVFDGLIDVVRKNHHDHGVMVILDSNHQKDHVMKELERYSSLVTPGCYLIVEDGNINGHPVFKSHGPGPYEAVEEFLQTNQDYEVDKERCEKFLLTFNPNGYLRRKGELYTTPQYKFIAKINSDVE